jgi:UDP-glucose 4-epimerase
VRILVTGSSGHIGTAVARRLIDDGHEVVGLGRRLTKENRLLSAAISADLGSAGLARALASKHARCDAVVHAAAAIEHDPYSPSIPLTNCFGTQQMLELATDWDVESFVYLSSLPVIGLPVQRPVTEQHPTEPRTAYHASKLFGEHLAAVAGHSGLPTVSLRLTAPVGPGMGRARILSVFVDRALRGEPLEVAGDGTRAQDYVDVRDIAAAVSACIEQRATGLLNIASGRCVSNLELAQRCVELFDSSSLLTRGGVADPEEGIRWEVSIAAAQEAIGYRPSHNLDDSIRAIADDLRSEPADD